MKKYANRQLYIILFMMSFFIFYSFRLFKLQLLDKELIAKAEITGIESQTVYPSRGLIYDRNDQLIAFNQFQNDIYFIYNDIDSQMDRQLLCDILSISDSSYQERINKDWKDIKYSKNVATLFMRKVSDTVASSFRENLFRFPGFEVRERTARDYACESAAHMLGYISEVNQAILDSSDYYSKGQYYGVSGLEKQYEQELRGAKGTSYLLKNNMGRNVGSYQEGTLDVAAEAGADLKLSIDIELQQFGEKLLENKKGAIVAIQPQTGEILAMMSAPAYGPSQLSISQERGKIYADLSKDTLKPLYDRSRMANYPPGSLFKPLLALIAQQEGVLSSDDRISCHGGYYYKQFSWNCHSHEAGSIHRPNIRSAISQSCNTFFFTVYRELIDMHGFHEPEKGLDVVVNYLDRMGLGRKLGIDLPSESKGLNPDVEFYNNIYVDNNWRSTYIISNGIGQGEVELTTVQMANLAAMIANRGYFRTPHLVKGFNDDNKNIDPKYIEKHDVGINPEYFVPVIDGMEDAIKYGTARAAWIPGLGLCGKTGTSENPHGEDHSVFFGFAPKENPQIAIAVFVENAGWGGTYAAPIGSLLCEEYITDTIAPNRKWLLDHVLNADLIHQ